MVFVGGFAAGLLVAFLAIGLMTEDSRVQDAVAMPVVAQSSTNLLEPIHWKRTTVTFHRTQSNAGR